MTFWRLILLQLKAFWDPENKTCVATGIQETKITVIMNFTTEFLLMTLMLIGVLRHRDSTVFGGLWNLLYVQVC